MNDQRRNDYAVILNPKSGAGQGASWLPQLKEAVASSGGRLFVTQQPRHASVLTRELCAQRTPLIFAAGGDDTVREVLDGLFSSHTTLGIIPLGTFNNFASSLGISGQPIQALQGALRGHDHQVDVGKIENGPHFIENLGVGVDAEAFQLLRHEETGRFKRWLGGLKLGLKAISAYAPKRIEVNIDGTPVSDRVMQVIIANSSLYGSGIRIAPRAKLDDGLLDVCIIPYSSKLRFIASAPIYYYGHHLEMLDVKYYQARRVSIRARANLPVRVDGLVTTTLPIKVHAIHNYLRIRLPDTLSVP